MKKTDPFIIKRVVCASLLFVGMGSVIEYNNNINNKLIIESTFSQDHSLLCVYTSQSTAYSNHCWMWRNKMKILQFQHDLLYQFVSTKTNREFDIHEHSLLSYSLSLYSQKNIYGNNTAVVCIYLPHVNV